MGAEEAAGAEGAAPIFKVNAIWFPEELSEPFTAFANASRAT